jgi:hypothetical protein
MRFSSTIFSYLNLLSFLWNVAVFGVPDEKSGFWIRKENFIYNITNGQTKYKNQQRMDIWHDPVAIQDAYPPVEGPIIEMRNIVFPVPIFIIRYELKSYENNQTGTPTLLQRFLCHARVVIPLAQTQITVSKGVPIMKFPVGYGMYVPANQNFSFLIQIENMYYREIPIWVTFQILFDYVEVELNDFHDNNNINHNHNNNIMHPLYSTSFSILSWGPPSSLKMKTTISHLLATITANLNNDFLLNDTTTTTPTTTSTNITLLQQQAMNQAYVDGLLPNLTLDDN